MLSTLQQAMVDVAERYSGPLVTTESVKFGLKPGESMDLTTGRDFNEKGDREAAWAYIQQRKQMLLIGSPTCTMFSKLQKCLKVVTKCFQIFAKIVLKLFRSCPKVSIVSILSQKCPKVIFRNIPNGTQCYPCSSQMVPKGLYLGYHKPTDELSECLSYRWSGWNSFGSLLFLKTGVI